MNNNKTTKTEDYFKEKEINNLNIFAEKENKNNKNLIDFDNINFENFDIYNFDFSKSLIKPDNENAQSNIVNQDKQKKEIINEEKDFALYKNLEEYICDNNLVDIINPKNLFANDRDDSKIKKIKNFEISFEEILEEKNKIIQDLKNIIFNLKSELDEQKKFSIVTVSIII